MRAPLRHLAGPAAALMAVQVLAAASALALENGLNASPPAPREPPPPMAAAVPPGESLGGLEPQQTYTDRDGRLCRVYARRVTIDGAPQSALATVCREANGRWVLSR